MNAEALEKLVLMKMPFGKYAGRALADLPGNYLAWFAREGFPKSELGQLLELMHTLDHNGLRGLLAPIQRAHGLEARSKLHWTHTQSDAITLISNRWGIRRTALQQAGNDWGLRLNLSSNFLG